MPAPITAPARDLLSAVIFNPPFMLLNVKLTAQLDIGSSKTGHCQSQIRPVPNFQMELSRRMELMPPHRLGAFASRGDFYRRDTMGLILLLVILVLLFGGGGFYMGPPYHYYGGGLGTILVIVIIVLLLRG
jgi:hypothetical protein